MKLRPCPKCNSKNIALDQRDYQIWPMCLNCHIMGEPRKTAEEAIAAWNWRYDDWIRIEDRLPEDNEFILAYDPKMKKINLIRGEYIRFGYASHWKSLPEAPDETD